MKQFKHSWALPILFISALLVRLVIGYVLVRDHSPGLFYDANEPSHIAANIVAGNGFSAPYANVPILPTAQQPPLYPFLLSAIFRLFGSFTLHSLWVAIAINALVGATTAVLIYFAGQQHFSVEVGAFSAWIWALWPWTAVAGLPLGYYGFSAFVVVCWLVLAPPILSKSRRKRDWASLGGFAGVIVLLNPALAPVLLASGAWLQFNKDSIRRQLVAALAFIAVLIPWTARNELILHRVVPVRDDFGVVLFLGNQPGMVGEEDFNHDFPGRDPRQYSQLGEIPYMELKQHEAMDFIRQYPGLFAIRVAKRFVAFWTLPSVVPFAILSCLAWMGAARATATSGSRPVGAFLLITFSILPIAYYITRIWALYRHPIDPLILLAAVSMIHQIVQLLPRRNAILTNAEDKSLQTSG